MKAKSFIAVFLTVTLLGMPIALAASDSYYSRTTVYFSIPKDATFSIAFPNDYTTWTTITGTDDTTTNTTTDYITFNFTSSPTQNALQEPYQEGASADAQAGNVKPIMYIDNTGSGALTFEIKADALPATGITLWFNASCTGTCSGTEQATATNITTAYQSLTDALETDEYLNLTLYANVSGGASVGVTDIDIKIKSTAN